MDNKKQSVGERRRQNSRRRVTSKITRWLVLGVFALFAIALLVAMGVGAIIVASGSWTTMAVCLLTRR